MYDEDKKTLFVLCCIIIFFGIVSKVAYDSFLFKVIQFLSKYIGTPLAFVLFFICWAIILLIILGILCGMSTWNEDL
jgi:uncharacterized membrane protein